VIGGSSAGASIQGSFLVRGDTRSNTIMMGDHQVGFGYLRNVGIDQHVLRRNRQFDLIEVVEAHPELLGIGIDENTALVVQGDQAEVIGASYVLVYDNRSTVGNGGKFYFLAPGDRLDLATREATRPATTQRPVEGPVRKPWGGG
ncbi:MAG: peptidase S51, partial [Gemmatimonadetes bacterium]|nr:peptidase S51 [Gemmatimonadota bacterium]